MTDLRSINFSTWTVEHIAVLLTGLVLGWKPEVKEISDILATLDQDTITVDSAGEPQTFIEFCHTLSSKGFSDTQLRAYWAAYRAGHLTLVCRDVRRENLCDDSVLESRIALAKKLLASGERRRALDLFKDEDGTMFSEIKSKVQIEEKWVDCPACNGNPDSVFDCTCCNGKGGWTDDSSDHRNRYFVRDRLVAQGGWSGSRHHLAPRATKAASNSVKDASQSFAGQAQMAVRNLRHRSSAVAMPANQLTHGLAARDDEMTAAGFDSSGPSFEEHFIPFFYKGTRRQWTRYSDLMCAIRKLNKKAAKAWLDKWQSIDHYTSSYFPAKRIGTRIVMRVFTKGVVQPDGVIDIKRFRRIEKTPIIMDRPRKQADWKPVYLNQALVAQGVLTKRQAWCVFQALQRQLSK